MRKLLSAAPLPVGSSLSSLSFALLPFEVWCAFLCHRCCRAFARVLLHVLLAVQLLVGAFLDVLVTELRSFKVFFTGFVLFLSRFLFLFSLLGWGFVRGNCRVSMEVTKLLVV